MYQTMQYKQLAPVFEKFSSLAFTSLNNPQFPKTALHIFVTKYPELAFGYFLIIEPNKLGLIESYNFFTIVSIGNFSNFSLSVNRTRSRMFFAQVLVVIRLLVLCRN